MDHSPQTVLLVRPDDTPVGTCPKLQAHQEGRLHRAFSLFLIDEEGNLLLQRRAAAKYHSGGLWTNACCSHPMENVLSEARLRLREELGVDTEVEEIGHFVYRHVFENGLTEYEYDHVLLGRIRRDTPISPDPSEADAVQWMSAGELTRQLTEMPHVFTPWFITAAPIVLEYLAKE